MTSAGASFELTVTARPGHAAASVAGYADVYALQVEDTPAYYAEGVLSHNSDVVCYLCATEEFSAWEFPVTPTAPVDPRAAIKLAASQKAMRGPGLGNI